jgi:DNA-binding SARP family transcriptional activator
VAVPAGQQRIVLAVLAAAAGHTVSTERLIDTLWPARPPAGAANTVRAYVMRLRRLVGAAVVQTVSRGYRLAVSPGELDATLFERLVAQARRDLSRGRPEPAASAFGAALGLWRGPAFADVRPCSVLAAASDHLQLLRLGAAEERAGLLIDLGRHAEVVDDLRLMVAEQPLRERRWTLWMTALQRCGRRAEALGAFHQARRTLRDELGLEPAADLYDLQSAILSGERRGYAIRDGDGTESFPARNGTPSSPRRNQATSSER